jgi:hypothetical protein
MHLKIISSRHFQFFGLKSISNNDFEQLFEIPGFQARTVGNRAFQTAPV